MDPFNMMEAAQKFLQMFNAASEQGKFQKTTIDSNRKFPESNRIQHLQNHPIATSIVNLQHSEITSAFKEFHPNLNLLQRQATNFQVLVDFLGQAGSPNHQIPQPPLHQGPIETPTMLESDVDYRRVMKNHRRVRLRLKKSITQAEKLIPGTVEFKKKFTEAKEHYGNCEVYKDERIRALKKYLFNLSKNNEMPQKVDIVNVRTGAIYAHWTKQNGLGKRRNPSWVSIKRNNHLLHQEWKNIAAKIDEEQEKQLRLGFIYADKEQAHATDDS